MIKEYESFINSIGREAALMHWYNYMIRVAIDSRRMLGYPPQYAVEDSDGPINIQIIIPKDASKSITVNPLPIEKEMVDSSYFLNSVREKLLGSTNIDYIFQQAAANVHWKLYMLNVKVVSGNLIEYNGGTSM